MAVADIACALIREASAVDERRLLVLTGAREQGYEDLEAVLDAVPVPISATTLVGPEDRLRCEQLPQERAGQLLGTTRELIVLDAHDQFRPNALGRVVGAVDGGGLLVLLAPSLESWPDRRDEADQSLAIPPFAVDDVTGHFRQRLVETLRAHRGIAIVDCDTGTLQQDGLTQPPPGRPRNEIDHPTDHQFPTTAYDACYTQDQVDAVTAFEALADTSPAAVVLEADRGRGKSSAAGLAAGSLAAAGDDVIVTAPAARNASELFARASELLTRCSATDDPPPTSEDGHQHWHIEAPSGGSVRFVPPADAATQATAADVVLVDEAAALPVSRLESLLVADRIGFATTIHGYEGAGRGFSVRFRDRLEASEHTVTTHTLVEPIRYAAGDPLEVWAFRALLLDARPPVDPVVDDATVDTVTYRQLTPTALCDDERLLRETFGLLVLAHYRTEPNDLARLLDAPNLIVRALCHDGHVVSVILLAREGNLPAAQRNAMYEGERIRGNMLPDVLTSQLRDEDAGAPAGLRVMRIATHHAVRSRGLGSLLLKRVREEFGPDIDWLGTSFGATPALLSFWEANGYATVHLSTTRNAASGEHSALMLSPTSPAGQRLHDRHARRFCRRFPAVSSAPLSTLEPDVARAALKTVDATPPLELTDYEWEVIAGAAYGPGLIDVDPGPFRALVVRALVDGTGVLADREERVLVRGVLQGREWGAVADEFGYQSSGQCLRALGDALCPLVDRYGTEPALAVRDRFTED